jgi:hypothetical protein
VTDGFQDGSRRRSDACTVDGTCTPPLHSMSDDLSSALCGRLRLLRCLARRRKPTVSCCGSKASFLKTMAPSAVRQTCRSHSRSAFISMHCLAHRRWSEEAPMATRAQPSLQKPLLGRTKAPVRAQCGPQARARDASRQLPVRCLRGHQLLRALLHLLLGRLHPPPVLLDELDQLVALLRAAPPASTQPSRAGPWM